MFMMFVYIYGIVHYEFVPKGETLNQNFYLDVLQCLQEDVRQRRPEKWCSGD